MVLRVLGFSPKSRTRSRFRLNVASCKANSSQKYHWSTRSNTRRSVSGQGIPGEPLAQRLAIFAAELDLFWALHRRLHPYEQ